MAAPNAVRQAGAGPIGQFANGLFGLLMLLGILLGAVRALQGIDVVNHIPLLVGTVRWGGIGLLLLGLWSLSSELHSSLRARQASSTVDQALKEIQKDTSLIDVSNAAVIAKLAGGVKMSGERLELLVEQRKQRALIDERAFQREVEQLIVKYLQPLPRNAKRVLNRFRVMLLIAHRRQLLTSEPRVTIQQIGKWVILGERWPGLRQALSAAPEKIALLDPRQAPGASTLDTFATAIEALAPTYAGDEDLRMFIQQEAPPISAEVLTRLVCYGEPQSVPPGGATP